MENTNFISNPILTAIAQGINNRALIGGLILPVHMVGRSEFKYHALDPSLESFKAGDDALAATALPNEARLAMASHTASTEGYGLVSHIAQKTVDEAPEGYDPIQKAAESITKRLWLGHELRVAAMVKAAGNYKTTQALGADGTKKISDATADLPAMLLEQLERAILRPNQLTLGRDVATKLRTHPSIVAAISASGTEKGIVKLEALADLLEVDRILVGGALANSSKGKNHNLTNPWAGVFAGHYVDSGANPGMLEDDATFGFTAMSLDFDVSESFSADRGPRGTTSVKVASEMVELVTAKDAGVLLTSVL
mgnify:CR=1 FL=1